jgi:hypothetical protein
MKYMIFYRRPQINLRQILPAAAQLLLIFADKAVGKSLFNGVDYAHQQGIDLCR